MTESILPPTFGSELQALQSRILRLEAAVGIQRYATADLPPAANHEGIIAYDTTTNHHKRCDGTSWLRVADYAAPYVPPPGTMIETLAGALPSPAAWTGRIIYSTLFGGHYGSNGAAWTGL